MNKLYLWWLKRKPLSKRRRTLERLLRDLGYARSYASQVANELESATQPQSRGASLKPKH
jgi:hypothetical protein